MRLPPRSTGFAKLRNDDTLHPVLNGRLQEYNPVVLSQLNAAYHDRDNAVEEFYPVLPNELIASLGGVVYKKKPKVEKKEKPQQPPKQKRKAKPRSKRNRNKNKKKESIAQDKIVHAKKISTQEADKILAKIAGVRPTVINFTLDYSALFALVTEIAVMTVYEIQDRQSLFGIPGPTPKDIVPSYVLSMYWAIVGNHLARCRSILGGNETILLTSDYYIAPALAQLLQQLADYDAPNGVNYHHTMDQSLSTFYAQSCGSGGITAGGFHAAFATATNVTGQEPQFTLGTATVTPNNCSSRFPEVSNTIKRLVKNPVCAGNVLTRAPNAALYASPIAIHPGEDLILFRVPEPLAMPLSYLFLNTINSQELASSFYNVLNTIPGLVDTYVAPIAPHKLALWYWCCSKMGYLRGRTITDPLRECFGLSTKEMSNLTVHIRQFDYAFFAFHVFTTLSQNSAALSGVQMWQIFLYVLAYIWNKTPGCIRAAKVIPGTAGGFPSPFPVTQLATAYKVPLAGNQKLSFTLSAVSSGFCKPLRHKDIIYVPFFNIQPAATGTSPFWYNLANSLQAFPLSAYQKGPIDPTNMGLSTTVPMVPYPNYSNAAIPATNVVNYIPWLVGNTQPLWASTSIQRNAFMAKYRIANRMLTVSTIRKIAPIEKSADKTLIWTTFSGAEIVTQEAIIAPQAAFHAICSHSYFMDAGTEGVTTNISFHSSAINLQPNTTSAMVSTTNLEAGTTSTQGVTTKNAEETFNGFVIQSGSDVLPDSNPPENLDKGTLHNALSTVNGDIQKGEDIVAEMIQTTNNVLNKL